MNTPHMNRRAFIQVGAAGAAMAAFGARSGGAAEVNVPAKPALLGGVPVRTAGFPSWPVIDDKHLKIWREALEAKGWCRTKDGYVAHFEQEYAKLIGAKYCLATANGTSALFASLNALDIGPGDEVLVPPYTFVATVNVVLLQFALPVFVDTDRNTFQMDAGKVKAAMTEDTRAIIPVHLGGNVADLDTILAAGKEKNIPVVEDACQSHLAEWRGKPVASLGDTGCFSFQVTKNLSSGEGGAILTNREDLYERAGSFHTNGRAWPQAQSFGYVGKGNNVRMTEFQGALLLEQLTRLEAQSQVRGNNAAYLTTRLKGIPGLAPAEMYEGCTRNAYHLYMFRYDPEAFSGMPRDRFLEALRAEGISCSSGYTPLNKEPFLRETLNSRGYQRIYGKERIDACLARAECPENDRLCSEAVWFTQNMLIGPQSDMDDIANAIEKIHAHSKELIA